jgi:hypothetical protein
MTFHKRTYSNDSETLDELRVLERPPPEASNQKQKIPFSSSACEECAPILLQSHGKHLLQNSHLKPRHHALAGSTPANTKAEANHSRLSFISGQTSTNQRVSH